MTIKQLHYFIAVAEAKSFTNAARNYFIAQTAMSQQIMALEKELGFRLFRRTNRSVELTEAGAVLLERVKPLVLRLEDAVQSAAAEAGVEKHIFRIGINDQAVNHFFPPALRAFSQQHPRMMPMLISDNPLVLQETLADGSLDVALLGKQFYRPRAMLTAVELFTYHIMDYVLAVPAQFDLATRKSVDWEDLSGLPLIAYNPLREEQHGAELSALLLRHGVTAEIRGSTRSVNTALLYVEAGLGCCLLPAFAAELPNQSAVILPMASTSQDTMLLIHHKDAENPLIGEFLSVCRRTLHGS